RLTVLWCSANHRRRYPRRSATRADRTDEAIASRAVEPSEMDTRSRMLNGTDTAGAPHIGGARDRLGVHGVVVLNPAAEAVYSFPSPPSRSPAPVPRPSVPAPLPVPSRSRPPGAPAPEHLPP